MLFRRVRYHGPNQWMVQYYQRIDNNWEWVDRYIVNTEKARQIDPGRFSGWE